MLSPHVALFFSCIGGSRGCLLPRRAASWAYGFQGDRGGCRCRPRRFGGRAGRIHGVLPAPSEGLEVAHSQTGPAAPVRLVGRELGVPGAGVILLVPTLLRGNGYRPGNGVGDVIVCLGGHSASDLHSHAGAWERGGRSVGTREIQGSSLFFCRFVRMFVNRMFVIGVFAYLEYCC